jgi:nucleoside-diphosphate-sugar epimerase
LELAEIIWKKIKPGVPFRFVSDKAFTYDVQKRVPDTSKAKKILGYEATTTLEGMLDEVIPWIKEEIKTGGI